MAEKKEETPAADPGAAAAAAPAPSKLPLLLGILGAVANLAAIGVIVYTKILYVRPPITEATERKVLK